MGMVVKLLVGLVVLAVLVVGLAFYATRGVVRAADHFLVVAAGGDMSAAGDLMTSALRSTLDPQTLRGALVEHGLASALTTRWKSRAVENGRGAVAGTVTGSGADPVPIELDLIKRDGQRRVDVIRLGSRRLAAATADGAPTLPTPGQQAELLHRALGDFSLSAERRDMTHFHATLSRLWQQQVTVEKLNEVFARFMDNGAQRRALSDVIPVPTAPAVINDAGVRVFERYYPTPPQRLEFTEKFLREDGVWKLVGFRLKAADAPTVPALATP